MPVGTTPARRQLGRELQRLRKAAGLEINDVVAADIGSYTKIYRIEVGRVEVKPITVRALCDLYGVTDQDERRRLEALAKGTNSPEWWQAHSADIPEWFRPYVGLEEGAVRITAWDDSLVPGLLQTPDYARAIFTAGLLPYDAAAIDRYVDVRLDRQTRILDRGKPPTVVAVIGEGALARQVGSAEVMDGQLAHLCKLAERPAVDVRVLPFAAGAHPAMSGGFRILDFAAEADEQDLVYVEALVGGQYLARPEEVARYRTAWEKIHSVSVPIGEHHEHHRPNPSVS